MAFSRYFELAVLFFALSLVETIAAPNMELEECRRLATQGDAEAQWQLGKRYETGDGVKRNPMGAIAQYRKAADQGHREACAKLASYYETGTLVGKNPALAAKYRAMANGDDPEVAIADAKARARAKRYDEVEVAIDYIIGRNGKEKDPKTGIRLLYSAAKDNPDAQRVFCEAWDAGDINVTELDDHELELLIPWFRNAFNDGMRTCGHVLGIVAYDHKNWQAAIQYWTAAGNAGVGRSWYFLGSLLSNWGDKNFRGPKNLQNEQRAKSAFEKASKSNWTEKDDALFSLGLICLFGDDDKCHDYHRAYEIFAYFLKKHPEERAILFDYGWAGIMYASGTQFRQLEGLNRQLRAQSLAPDVRRNMQAQRDALRQKLRQNVRDYMRFIKQSADMGFEPAQKDYEYLNDLFNY